jgi:predicted  nucleic acid-binding Zn-ribbon protein
MRLRLLLSMTSLIWLVAVTAAAAASTEADFKAALNAVEAAESDAGALKNQWTATEATLTAARKAAAAGDFDTAVNDARQAEALAKASIAQATEQETDWRAAVIH